ncbi:MAG: sugar nucleotide-binding protein [Reinekea sp.]
MSLNSPSLRFVLLGSDTQTGMALVQQFEERQILYHAASVADLKSAEQVSDFLASHVTDRFVVNCLFEENSSDDSLSSVLWADWNQRIIHLCNKQQQTLISLSSMRVFSGKSDHAYAENEAPDSETSIGVVYQQLENQILESGVMAVILRVGWLFSEQLGNILTHLIRAAVRRESLRVSGNLRGCPTDANSVAKVIIAVAEQLDCNTGLPELPGIYHYADSDACTMHTFAKTVVTIVKSMTDVKVESIEEGDSPEMVDAVTEPENFEVSCKKILFTFGIKQRPWRRSVHEVLKKKMIADMGTFP